jgi:starch-binding outer membrane protein, SusD/RagB family
MRTDLKIKILLGLLVSLTSCSKLVEVELPRNQLVTERAFSNDETALAALNGLYIAISQNIASIGGSALTVYPAMTADEAYNALSPSLEVFSNNAITPEHTALFNSLWNPAYSFIYHANLIIEEVHKNSALSPSVRDMLEGEALFIRGFFYLQLAELFENVPLILTTDYMNNTLQGQVPKAVVYEQLVDDLIIAMDLLKEHYPNEGRSRVNKSAVKALLARVYLYSGQYELARLTADEVINEAQYNLEDDLSNVFLANSKEVIWQLRPVMPNFNAPEGNTFLPSNGTSMPLYVLTDTLMGAFEKDDNRKSAWIGRNNVNGEDYFYPMKYRVKLGMPVMEYNVMLRLAELYLIRAESKAFLRDVDGFLNDINHIRNRAGLESYAKEDISPTVDDMLTITLKERRVELFCEKGHRWFDLKRTGRADAELGSLKGEYWRSTAINYPIPASELLKNHLLVQNEGY